MNNLNTSLSWDTVGPQGVREINLRPSQRFDPEHLDPAIRRGLERATKTGHALVTARTKGFARTINGWVEALLVADFGTDYVNHAAVAMMGLLYNQKKVSTYYVGYFDSEGQPLDGSSATCCTSIPCHQWTPSGR